ncbi:hypothetical protein GALMADRAFT_1139983 [Galerina marginata CBS 339.88]|uniref:Uncharacterized protein n=1 Tax=Galerina marginata (strain CBS 339.88) TaxID=685588 RepID=A0A067S7B9_GALM3|nr:hypothetical protein GALMADRAFT_1139983 [Galerina marginata CBS 339.88]
MWIGCGWTESEVEDILIPPTAFSVNHIMRRFNSANGLISLIPHQTQTHGSAVGRRWSFIRECKRKLFDFYTPLAGPLPLRSLDSLLQWLASPPTMHISTSNGGINNASCNPPPFRMAAF